jgi:hypothetical protein
MPQFNTTGRNDVSGALSMAGGATAAKGKSPSAPKAALVSAMAKNKMLEGNKKDPTKLNYWMNKTGGRKNAAYAMWKRRKNNAGPKGGMR